MRLLRFDSVGGASGDMILAALVDLGVDPRDLKTGLSSLPIEPFDLEVEKTTDRGLRGTRVTVNVADRDHPHRTFADIRRVIRESRRIVEKSSPGECPPSSRTITSRRTPSRRKLRGTRHPLG